LAGSVAMPKIEQRAGNRPAAPVQHKAGEGDAFARHPVLEQVGALRGVGREIRALGLARRRFIAIAALSGDRQQALASPLNTLMAPTLSKARRENLVSIMSLPLLLSV
jgi:hypothetical protein